MKKLLLLFIMCSTIIFVSCSQPATTNRQLAQLGVDFTYWVENDDDNTNRPLVEMGNGITITIGGDAGSADSVVKRLNSLELTETDIDLSRYDNSVFIHRIALLQYETRTEETNINKTPYQVVWQFWFYDDFRYMVITDINGTQTGPVFSIADNTEIRDLYISQFGHMYITPRQYEKVIDCLGKYIIGGDKAQMEKTVKNGRITIPDSEFPDDFVFNMDYSRLSVARFVNGIGEEHYMVTGWMETGGVEYSYLIDFDTDDNGELCIDRQATNIFVWPDE